MLKRITATGSSYPVSDFFLAQHLGSQSVTSACSEMKSLPEKISMNRFILRTSIHISLNFYQTKCTFAIAYAHCKCYLNNHSELQRELKC